MVEEKKEIEESQKKKRGRRPKNVKIEYVLNKEQTKFFVDLSKNKNELKLVQDILIKVNDKHHGGEVLFKDIALFSIEKLTIKDIDKLQENSLSEMEKVQRSLDEYNTKNNLKLSLGEYLLKKLNLN
ncbi:hypothetical protein [Halobacteriovorax sp. JY17]|uniref:hypothetical protein n=1 Tax=Halobacteriovorax sp. JY17 TaxID=2014617 RepID=UPI000C583E21|nr:hypothetical protein [Halobacteriovorax sp. JY17]PIK13525.1 MAG: hypothetical protein CES88_16530 [Halobacteriovorax sp. JY17]